MKQIQIFAAFDKDATEDIVRFGDFLCVVLTPFGIHKDKHRPKRFPLSS